MAAAKFHLDVNGTLWFPVTSGPDPVESRVLFQLNATVDLKVTLRLASTLAPISTAQADVELRDASGAVLAGTTFNPPGVEPNERTLEVASVPPGAYGLHFATRGGSDGSSGGDHIAYRIQAAGTGEVAGPDLKRGQPADLTAPFSPGASMA